MRMVTAGVVGAALACASLTAALGQAPSDAVSSATTTAKKTLVTKACTSAADALVWFVPGAKLFYRKGQAGFGKGAGQLVCRHIALGKHARPAPTPAPTAEPTSPANETMRSDTTPAPVATMSTFSSPVPTVQPSPQASSRP